MSNEKLGAEQGLGDASLEALAQALYDGAECNVLDDYKRIIAKWQAEHAYHARGAGREALNIEEVDTLLMGRFGISSVTGQEDVQWLMEQLNKLIEHKLREPGADTGTTPPIEELISKWSNELVYSLDEAEIDLIEKIAPLILRDMAAAERGTTPPEGQPCTEEFRQTLRGRFWDWYRDHGGNITYDDSAGIIDAVRDALTPTQRAPVSKGDDDGMS